MPIKQKKQMLMSSINLMCSTETLINEFDGYVFEVHLSFAFSMPSCVAIWISLWNECINYFKDNDQTQDYHLPFQFISTKLTFVTNIMTPKVIIIYESVASTASESYSTKCITFGLKLVIYLCQPFSFALND